MADGLLGTPQGQGAPGSSSPGSPSGSPPGSPSPSAPEAMLSQARGEFDAMKKEFDIISKVRSGLDKLIEKGSSVDENSVMDEMARLVGHGVDPKLFAALMAGNPGAGLPPMPIDGEALAGWLKTLDTQILAPWEQQVRPAMALARHNLGIAGVHRMIEVAGPGGAPGAAGATPGSAPSLGGNPLAQGFSPSGSGSA